MTLYLDKIVANFPDLKEGVELLIQHENYVLLRTIRNHTTGQYGEYESKVWYVLDLSSGETFPVANNPRFKGSHLKGAHVQVTPFEFEPAQSDVFVVEGVPFEAKLENRVVAQAIKSLVESQVSGDEIRKGLESSGVDMKSLYSTNYKLEKNYNGGWKVKTDTGDHSIADFLARLAEMTTT